MPLKKKTVAMMIAAGGLACTTVWATSISVVGLFKDKAIVSIDGGKPRTLSAGQTIQGVKLVSADSDSASFDIEGKHRTLGMGQSFAGGTATDGRPALTSSVVAAGSSPPATASVPGRLIFLPFLALRWGFPGVDRMRGRPRRGVPPAPTAAAYAGGRRAVPKGPFGDVGRRISLFPAQYGSSAARVGT